MLKKEPLKEKEYVDCELEKFSSLLPVPHKKVGKFEKGDRFYFREEDVKSAVEYLKEAIYEQMDFVGELNTNMKIVEMAKLRTCIKLVNRAFPDVIEEIKFKNGSKIKKVEGKDKIRGFD